MGWRSGGIENKRFGRQRKRSEPPWPLDTLNRLTSGADPAIKGEG